MKFIQRLSLLSCLAFMLISATSTSLPPTDPGIAARTVAPTIKQEKPTLVQKIFNFFLGKRMDDDTAKADRQAETSLILGISAFGALLIGMVVPFVALLSIPLGIVAMTTGGSALRNNTTREGAARTGRGLGLGAIITLGAILLLSVILLASWGWY